MLTATLTSAGAGLPSQTGTLQSQPVGGSTWTNGTQAATDSAGQVHFTVKPAATTIYRVVFAATAAYEEADSNTVRITQHPKVNMYLPTIAPILTPVKVKGNLRPVQTGEVRLQRFVNGAWHLRRPRHCRAPVATSSRSSCRRSRPTSIGSTDRRMHTRPVGYSASAKVLGVDRALRSGLSGPDVTALQRRLAALHYDVGRITGTYNFDTQHAVTAFEKVQRMTRDGVVGTAVWKALGAPRLPHLRHPLRGAAVEVDLTRQVLYYAVNGKIVRIFDSSTGGGYYYTGLRRDAVSARSHRPGHFAIRYKVNHWVKSKLGVLYRPAYFNYSGYAIHGEPEVPSYPPAMVACASPCRRWTASTRSWSTANRCGSTQ